MARPPLNLLQQLPEAIPGDRIELRVSSPSLWPMVAKLTESQREHVLDGLNWSKEDEFNLTNEKDYASFCEHMKCVESLDGARVYWVIDPATQRIIGTLDAVASYGKNVLAIGYQIFPDYRERGFATEAVKTLSDCALARRHIFRFICAENLPGNEASIRVLQSCRFQEYPSGQSSTSMRDAGAMACRFLKTSGRLPDHWPLNPIERVAGR